jgi:hypothetical protein
MGKAARLRRERAGGQRHRTIRVVFCDVDYERSSRAHGPGVAPAPPEGWVVERAGLVHGEWDGTALAITGSEIVAGPDPAGALIGALSRAELVVGHGLLTSDLRAVAMVTDVPDALLRRTVDLLALAHRLRGGNFPSGCNLNALAMRNELGFGPTKMRYAADFRPAPGKGLAPLRRDAGIDDPCHDALIIARLWEKMLVTGHLAWGTTVNGFYGADGEADLEPGHTAELVGGLAQPEAAQWRERARSGRIMLPTRVDGYGALLFRLGAGDLPEPAQVGQLADRLREAGEIPADRVFSREELYTACQHLGVQQNIDVRERIADGRKPTKLLRVNLGWALWQIAHSAWSSNYNDTSRLASSKLAREGVAAAMLRMNSLNAQKDAIRARVARVVA